MTRLMDAKGLSLEDLVRYGVPRSTASRLKHAEADGRLTHLHRIAEALGVKLSHLFVEGYAQMLLDHGVDLADPTNQLHPRECGLLMAFRSLPDSVQLELVEEVERRARPFDEVIERVVSELTLEGLKATPRILRPARVKDATS